MNKKKIVFYTIVDDRYYYGVGTPILVNSFKRFHPEIDLVVFRQDMVDKVFKEKNINFYCAKPVFAKLLTDKYDLVVNIDADTVITGRLIPIIEGDYEVGAVWNFNDYENTSVENITEKMYVQAGLVGSRNPKFWDTWEKANEDAMRFKCQENDILNLIWYNNSEVRKMKKVIWDKDYGYMGCKSLGRESEFYVDNGKLWCRKEPVLAYHHAKGGCLPKLQFMEMGFTGEVVNYLAQVSFYGQTEVYGNL